MNKKTFKHQRGRHDQRTHGIWAEGMGGTRDGNFGQSGGGIANNMTFGNRRDAYAMTLANRRQGNSGQPTTPLIENKDVLRQQIRNFRNRQRPVQRINTRPFSSQIRRPYNPVNDQNVFTFSYQGRNGRQELNYYPVPPRGTQFSSRFDQPKANPIVGSSIYMPLLVDDFATALGLDIVPVAQMTSNGGIVTNNIPGLDTQKNPIQYVDNLLSQMKQNPSAEMYQQIESILEPIVAMEMLFGLSEDNNSYALVPGKAAGSNLQYAIARVKNDHSGNQSGESFMSGRLQMLRKNFSQYRSRSDTGFFSKNMTNMLQGASQNIQWNSSVPDMMKNQVQDRLNTLARIGNVTDLGMQTQLSLINPKDLELSQAARPFVNGDENAKHTLSLLNEVVSRETKMDISEEAISEIIRNITGKSYNDFYNEIVGMIQRPIKTGQQMLNSNLSQEEQKKLTAQGNDILQANEKELKKAQEQIQQVSEIIGQLLNWQRNFVAYSFMKPGGVLFADTPGSSRSGKMQPNIAIDRRIVGNFYKAHQESLSRLNQTKSELNKIQKQLNDLDATSRNTLTPRHIINQKRNPLLQQQQRLTNQIDNLETELDQNSGEYIHFAMSNILSNPAMLKKLIATIQDIPKNNVSLKNPRFVVKMLHELF